MLSDAYCDQIAYAPFSVHYNRLLIKNLVFVIIGLMQSVLLGPIVITLSRFHLTVFVAEL
jgi:hypothetical protein